MTLSLLITVLLASPGLLPGLEPRQELSDPASEPGRTVSVRRDGREVSCTIVVENESVRVIAAEIAQGLGVDLLGFEGVKRTALVTADLRDRPVRQALEFVFGSVGLRGRLRADALTIEPDVPPSERRADRLTLASAAYLRAQSEFPGHPLAASARVSQGTIEEARGNWLGAIEQYQGAIDDYSTSPHVAEALYRAGLMHERMSAWAEASHVLRQLTNLGMEHDYDALARTELARCMIRMRDFGTALHLLKILSERYPPESVEQARDRDMLAAEALLGAGEQIGSLRKLERLESSGLELGERLKVHALRASAFEQLGLVSEAGRAWLIFASDSEGPERARALERAVILAERQEDPLSVLFAAEQAEGDPYIEDLLAPYIERARDSLGMGSVSQSSALPAEQRLDRAEVELAAGNVEEARDSIAGILDTRRELAPEARVRFARSWASVLEQVRSLEAAITFLAGERIDLRELRLRSQLDVHAASLFEKHEKYAEAVEAYEGRYR